MMIDEQYLSTQGITLYLSLYLSGFFWILKDYDIVTNT